MNKFLLQKNEGNTLPILLGLLAVLAGGAYGVYNQIQLNTENLNLKVALNISEENLVQVKNENSRLISDLHIARGDIDEVTGQVGELAGTIKKLNEIDPELLKKYSKVSFLNENYVPRGLEEIDKKYLFDQNKSALILSKANVYLRRLMDISVAYELDLKILSAYRSFDTQSTLKASYKFTYGAGTANQFSAEQGYSEHQLGTTVDFTTSKIGGALSGFNNTKEYEWLLKNAHKYGFVLSYPPNNTYYMYEPWHWRFVGIELATRLHEEDQYFYDLEQRQIDPYLINMFD